MKFALFFRFFDSWYIIKYLLTDRQSRVRKTYCFPRPQSISVKYRQQNRMCFFVFPSFSAVFPLKFLHIDQTHVLLTVNKTLFNM